MLTGEQTEKKCQRKKYLNLEKYGSRTKSINI